MSAYFELAVSSAEKIRVRGKGIIMIPTCTMPDLPANHRPKHLRDIQQGRTLHDRHRTGTAARASGAHFCTPINNNGGARLSWSDQQYYWTFCLSGPTNGYY